MRRSCKRQEKLETPSSLTIAHMGGAEVEAEEAAQRAVEDAEEVEAEKRMLERVRLAEELADAAEAE